ncbi:GIY-YIG nuclease family protein [Candidatus Enterococcus courvalinii]|uniref:GIY-YIG nuclease family protein n=1 Tax=Candidatus Enterococcus courvalinii TaxID=2815329 RepID=A0ABS3HXZ1_9ENTE|nr:GIY-YIG nuclease family protein [Enterococcus sp. MSG2901]MBO0480930.1 GIY-YIG nuclease family protein [Enterococcus sp. MSG2901]
MDKKEMKMAYREREQIGGIYKISNTKSGTFWLDYAQDVLKVENRFEFMKKMNQPFSLIIAAEWKADGKDAFSFKIIETMKKKPEQSENEFKKDLIELLELKKEELAQN